jgi:hypothetical protein
MYESANLGNRFQQTDGHRSAGTAILPDLVERRIRDVREREDRRNDPKLILSVMAIRRRHVSLSQATQCRPQVVHTRHRRERVIHPGGEGSYRDFDELVDRELNVLTGRSLVTQGERGIDRSTS